MLHVCLHSSFRLPDDHYKQRIVNNTNNLLFFMIFFLFIYFFLRFFFSQVSIFVPKLKSMTLTSFIAISCKKNKFEYKI